MSRRRLVQVFCSRTRAPHRLASVYVDDGAQSVILRDAVRTGTDTFEARELRVPLDGFEGRRVYCQTCRMTYRLQEENLRDAVRRGVPLLVLQSDGYNADPLGVLTRRQARHAQK